MVIVGQVWLRRSANRALSRSTTAHRPPYARSSAIVSSTRPCGSPGGRTSSATAAGSPAAPPLLHHPHITPGDQRRQARTAWIRDHLGLPAEPGIITTSWHYAGQAGP